MNMDDELKKKLALWNVRPEIPPGFQRGVWNRIAARDSKSSKNFFAISWLTLPRLAACAFVISILTGTGLGLVESSSANAKNWRTLEEKYVQSIDPYQRLGTY
jgi:hypothetical protein